MHLGSFFGSHFFVSLSISLFANASKSSACAAGVETIVNAAPATNGVRLARKSLLLLDMFIVAADDRVGVDIGDDVVNAIALFPPEKSTQAVIEIAVRRFFILMVGSNSNCLADGCKEA